MAFKVHRGMLARHSEIFQSMFDIPQPANALGETLEGSQVVRMHDLPVELSNLIKALYDGASFKTLNLDDFYYLAGILRLSTKYAIDHLRHQAIKHLTSTWSYTLRGHDVMVELALNSPVVDDTTYPYVHPIHVINLAMETNVRIVVPSAMYFLSLYLMDDILRGDHPKLIVDHPSRPSSQLRDADVQAYTLMFQHRLNIILDFLRKTVGGREADESICRNNQKPCTRGFNRLSARLSRSWQARTGPFQFMVQANQEIASDETICRPCRVSFKEDVSLLRGKLWDELPAIIHYPGWDNMVAEDLPIIHAITRLP